MKKVIRIASLCLGILLVALLLSNLIDGGDPGAPALLPTPAVVDDAQNGFFHLWLLAAPTESDVTVPTTLEEVRRTLRPSEDLNAEEQAQRAAFLKSTREKPIHNPPPPADNGTMTMEYFRQHQALFRQNATELAVQMQRYQRMLQTTVFADLTPPRFDAPLPNLVYWLRMAKVYTADACLRGAAGEWQDAADRLLRQVAFCRTVDRGSTVLITRLVAKAVCRISLVGLAELMNQKDCPPEIFRRILEALPPAPHAAEPGMDFHGEFAVTDRMLIGEPDVLIREMTGKPRIPHWLIRLTLQKNHTRGYYRQARHHLERMSRIPPFQWSENALGTMPDPTRGPFWWWRNAGGKLLFRSLITNMTTVVHKNYTLQVQYDLLRIAAELHLAYTPEKSMAENLAGLAAYRVPDPYSGRPYRFNETRNVLYSVGPNGRDDGGVENSDFLTKGDTIQPCVPFVRPPAAPVR